MNNGSDMGSMKSEVKDFQLPSKAYSESYDQAPLRYVERNDAQQVKAGSKLRSQAYKGRYN